MPFLGSIEPPVREFLAHHHKIWKDRNLVIGTSGNFTSERVLWAVLGKVEVNRRRKNDRQGR